jgi:hypothetical protein
VNLKECDIFDLLWCYAALSISLCLCVLTWRRFLNKHVIYCEWFSFSRILVVPITFFRLCSLSVGTTRTLCTFNNLRTVECCSIQETSHAKNHLFYLTFPPCPRSCLLHGGCGTVIEDLINRLFCFCGLFNDAVLSIP